MISKVLTTRIIALESRSGPHADSAGRTAFRACEKLQRSLGILVGTIGFRSLLSRALTLARVREPWLDSLEIDPVGGIAFSERSQDELDSEASAAGGAALLADLLGLLVILVGESLTVRLLQDVWPNLAMPKPVTEKVQQ
jgi:predicted nuclease with RNAse H fold